MLGEFERYNERDAINHQTRIWINAERAAIDNPGSDIAALFRYWRERALIGDGLPLQADFRPPLSRVPWLDVETANPLHFQLHNHPAGVCGDWDSARLAEYPVPMHAKSCAMEYLRCKNRREPAYIHIRQKLLDVEREYAKLLLPVVDETGDVVRVYYAWRFTCDPIVLSTMNSSISTRDIHMN